MRRVLQVASASALVIVALPLTLAAQAVPIRDLVRMDFDVPTRLSTLR